MAVIPHPPYFPDLAPYDFFLFPKIKLKLNGRRLANIKEIQLELQRGLDTLTVDPETPCRRELLRG
jgi:hypothetical protein